MINKKIYNYDIEDLEIIQRNQEYGNKFYLPINNNLTNYNNLNIVNSLFLFDSPNNYTDDKYYNNFNQIFFDIINKDPIKIETPKIQSVKKSNVVIPKLEIFNQDVFNQEMFNRHEVSSYNKYLKYKKKYLKLKKSQ
jgi:hypothetical protein